jgi:hypothetical protein
MASIRSVRQRELRARLDALPSPEQPTKRYRLAPNPPEPPERAQVSLTIPITDRRLATAAAEPPAPPVEAARTDTPLRLASLAPTVRTRLPEPTAAEPVAGESVPATAGRTSRSPKPRWLAVVLVVLTAAVVLLLKAHVWQS